MILSFTKVEFKKENEIESSTKNMLVQSTTLAFPLPHSCAWRLQEHAKLCSAHRYPTR
jgi:hypothetical protein